jgi:hypothetical protein
VSSPSQVGRPQVRNKKREILFDGSTTAFRFPKILPITTEVVACMGLVGSEILGIAKLVS